MAECKKGFLHGGDLQGAAEKSGRRPSELLDFSANINPLGMPPGVREAVLESLAGAAAGLLAVLAAGCAVYAVRRKKN